MNGWVLAEFDSAERLLAAIKQLRTSGFTSVDYFSPYPLHGGDEALGVRPKVVQRFALFGGLAGVATAYLIQLYASLEYPLNAGNRPAHAPPSFVPVTFELGVLFASLAIFLGLMFLLRLPRPHHPAFELDAFRSASTHAFWVGVEADPASQGDELRRALTRLGALNVSVVEEPLP